LNEEFKFCFDKNNNHKSTEVAKQLKTPPISDVGLTEFAQAMPEKYHVSENAVQAYRNFYIGKKSGFTTWTKRPIPDWFQI
jgi:hypothetical protein